MDHPQIVHTIPRLQKKLGMNEEKNINDQLLENYHEVMVPNYAPANFVVKKAIGSWVWDVNDKKYVDFGGGIAVNSLGHSHPELLKALEEQILADGGSVQDIKALDNVVVGEHNVPIKEVYKTFKEINQLELVNQAGIRQQYIDQAVSLNLAFPSEVDPKWLNKTHLEAWKRGIKTLYYTL